ncbi:uncharacterized protein LOC128558900 [Mercenaria mercenaria]|uniref:uncharacterized protein LOC128558900 n=1 Tax=Mercenaria mercenaria TaxID=6596 RepID=UPI00234F5C67|nr:uncharacterized protein LOC128558900 [Mercenaria mercenaria]
MSYVRPHQVSGRNKRNRRFIRIQSRRKWQQQNKIQKEIQRGKETVKNLSSRELTNCEYRLLGKGLKFCLKPKHHNEIQLKQEIFEFTRRLRLKEYFCMPEEDSDGENDCDSAEGGKNKQKYKKKHSIFTPPSGRDSTLDFYIDAITHELLQKNSKYRFRPNLSTDELSALKNLRNDDSIILKKSDKGSVIVVMNRTDYIAEVNRQLNNTAYYKKLDHNPVEQFSKDVTDVLDVICRNVNGDSNDTLAVPSDARTPQFYILPKIHKDINSELPLGYPGRPIVSGYTSVTEGISEYIDNILKPHMEALPSYVKDSTDFIKKLGSMPNISPNAFLVTMDVSSLYPNIPHDDGIEACREYLDKAHSYLSHQSVNDICQLIELVSSIMKIMFKF